MSRTVREVRCDAGCEDYELKARARRLDQLVNNGARGWNVSG